MKKSTEPLNSWCSVDYVLNILSTRWTTSVLNELREAPKRPSQLMKALPRVSAKTLTQRLRELETHGFLHREAYDQIPPRVIYSLTNRGNDLVCLLDAINEYGHLWHMSARNSSATIGGDSAGDVKVSRSKHKSTMSLVPASPALVPQISAATASSCQPAEEESAEEEVEEGDAFFTYNRDDYRRLKNTKASQ